MKIGILIFDQMTQLDATGPFEPRLTRAHRRTYAKGLAARAALVARAAAKLAR